MRITEIDGRHSLALVLIAISAIAIPVVLKASHISDSIQAGLSSRAFIVKMRIPVSSDEKCGQGVAGPDCNGHVAIIVARPLVNSVFISPVEGQYVSSTQRRGITLSKGPSGAANRPGFTLNSKWSCARICDLNAVLARAICTEWRDAAERHRSPANLYWRGHKVQG